MKDLSKIAENNLILKICTGSILYGTNTPSSDTDFIGIFLPTKEMLLGTQKCDIIECRTNPPDSGHRNTNNDVDTTYYSLPKFISLATQNNPNILETLFVNEDNILECSSEGKQLLSLANKFVSKRIYKTFGGYAHAQKMKLSTKAPIGGRSEYIKKYGYDVKFAYHLLRLLSEGTSLLKTGKLSFPLPIADFLRDVKNGRYQLEIVLDQATAMERALDDAYDKSTLPENPDISVIESFQIETLLNSLVGQTLCRRNCIVQKIRDIF